MTDKNTDGDSPEFLITGFRKSDENGEILIDYRINEEFKTWYKKKNNLKRWSRKRFEKDLRELVLGQMAADMTVKNNT